MQTRARLFSRVHMSSHAVLPARRWPSSKTSFASSPTSRPTLSPPPSAALSTSPGAGGTRRHMRTHAQAHMPSLLPVCHQLRPCLPRQALSCHEGVRGAHVMGCIRHIRQAASWGASGTSGTSRTSGTSGTSGAHVMGCIRHIRQGASWGASGTSSKHRNTRVHTLKHAVSSGL